MIELFAAAFAIGFLGSLHCVGMCGGLVGAMSMSRSETWWPGLIAYQFGRLTSYTTLGLIAGLIGSLFIHSDWLGQAQNILASVAGILIIVLALHIGGWLPDPFARLSRHLFAASGLSRLIKAAATTNATGPWYGAGLVNGLLPCGLVYAGIGLSLSAASSWQGAAAMFSFGLGTLPAMLSVPALLRAITPANRGRVLKLGALLLILIGAITLVRGGLMGQHQHGGHADQLTTLDPDSYCIPAEFGAKQTSDR